MSSLTYGDFRTELAAPDSPFVAAGLPLLVTAVGYGDGQFRRVVLAACVDEDTADDARVGLERAWGGSDE